MEWLNFSKYENRNAKFTANLSKKGGYVTFSNSGKGGNKKYFTLSLESFLVCLRDILSNHSAFLGHEKYVEREWRNLGSKYYTNKAANAQCTVQTKPMFATLSKIIMWANAPKYDSKNPEEEIVLGRNDLENAIDRLEDLSEVFTPTEGLQEKTFEKTIVLRKKSVREFARDVFAFFFENRWSELINETKKTQSKMGDINFVSHDFEIFNRLVGEFDSAQDRETLMSSKITRYFEEPVLEDDGKFYYFTNQWNGEGNYSLSFSNLKDYFEKKFPEYLLKKNEGFYYLVKADPVSKVPFDINLFISALEDSGLIYSDKLVKRFVASLLTKPFVILTGLSGSGKTKLAQAFVQWICQDESQYRIVPVGADWTNREPLLGYPNALDPKEYVKPDSDVLDLIIHAKNHSHLPHYLILDEMNLSHVERYFADFLSVMESKEEILLYSEGTAPENGVPPKLGMPDNLFIIGTVNIDETTNMFSPKVLDRANTIEFRVTGDEMKNFLGNIRDVNLDKLETGGSGMAESFLSRSAIKSVPAGGSEINSVLINFFEELSKTGAEFGYRSATEILRLIHQLSFLDSNLTNEEKTDIALSQKLLPKLHGSRRKLCPVLETLGELCIQGEIKIIKDIFEKPDFSYKGVNVIYPVSLEKIARMYRGAIDNGFASFAEA